MCDRFNTVFVRVLAYDQYRVYMTVEEWQALAQRKEARIMSNRVVSAEVVYDGATNRVYMRPHGDVKRAIELVNENTPYGVTWRDDI